MWPSIHFNGHLHIFSNANFLPVVFDFLFVFLTHRVLERLDLLEPAILMDEFEVLLLCLAGCYDGSLQTLLCMDRHFVSWPKLSATRTQIFFTA